MLFASIAILGAARAGIASAAMPLFVLFGGVVILGERLGPIAWFGVAIILISLFLLSFDAVRKSGEIPGTAPLDDALPGEKPAKTRIRLLMGIGFGVAASVFLGSGNVFRKAGISIIPDAVIALSFCSFFALLACVITLLIRRKGKAMLASIKDIEINYLMTGISSSAMLFTFFLSLQYIPISIGNSIASTSPLFTILFVWLLKEGKAEKLGIRTIIYGIMMVIGTIVLIAQ